MAGMTLHIFPTHGSWVQTPLVEILSTLPSESIHDRANYYLRVAGRLPATNRDDLFDLLGDRTVRETYDDIIVHAEPYAALSQP